MSYLGTVDQKNANIQHYALTGSTATTVDIGWIPPSEQSLRVTINGVVQQGGTFSLSGSNLTLGGALVSTDNLEVVGIQSVGNIITPAENSVTTAKLADDAVTTAKILDNNVTLAKMADGTQGGVIHYGAAGAPVELAAGTNGYFLKTQGAGANPAWAAVSTTSDIELLNTYEPSGVSEVVVDTASYFSSTYKGLKFKFINMHPVTDNVHLRFQLGIGATPVYTGANFYTNFGIMQSNGTTNWWQYEASYGGSGAWGVNFATLFKEIGNDTDESVGGELELFNPGSSTFETVYQSLCSGHLYNDYMLTCFGGGGYNVSDAITGIRFYFNSGNIDSGIIKVYGLR